MKNYLGSFSKLFLISLLAGSMMLAGCGESNPTGANVSDETTNQQSSSNNNTTNTTEEQQKTYTVSGKVSPTNGYVASNANFEVTFKDSQNNTKGTTKGIVFTFSGIKAGTYTLTAKETTNGNYSLQNPVTVNVTDADQSNLEIIMNFTGELPTYTLKGVVVDNQNQGIKFATITADNGIKTVETTTNPDNGNFTLENLTPGDYQLTIKADSFKDSNLKLFIDEEGKKIKLDNNKTVNNYDLGNLKLMPNYTNSGAIEGILTDPTTGKAVPQGTKVYIYKRNNDSTVLPSFVTTVITDNEKGYFSIDSLSADFYSGSIGEVGNNWVISKDKDGNPLSYDVPINQHCFGWLQVVEGATSKVPGYSK